MPLRSANKFRPVQGDVVEVKSEGEILSGLSSSGCLDNLPFMPEMLAFCGKTCIVQRRLEKTCVEGCSPRFLPRTLTLRGAYCDGSGHDGCNRMCPLLWKESWLLPAGSSTASVGPPKAGGDRRRTLPTKNDNFHYFCQSTELKRATIPIRGLGFFRLFYEFHSGNMNFPAWTQILLSSLMIKFKMKCMGPSSVQPVGQADATPLVSLNLMPGEKVTIKPPAGIAATLDRSGRNRGLPFTPEMATFCGKSYRVKSRVDRIIHEQTGEMKELQNTVILDGVTCEGRAIVGGCSRQVFHFWREGWLERSGE